MATTATALKFSTELARGFAHVAEIDDSAKTAHLVMQNGLVWAKRIVERAKAGNPSKVAYRMLSESLTTSRQWTKKVIEKDKVGDPAWAAFLMVRNGFFPPNDYGDDIGSKYWAKRVIERAETGFPPSAAFAMAYCGLASAGWAQEIIEESKIGDPAWAAYLMVFGCFASKGWAKRIIEDAEIGETGEAAYEMGCWGFASKGWAKRIIKKTRDPLWSDWLNSEEGRNWSLRPSCVRGSCDRLHNWMIDTGIKQ